MASARLIASARDAPEAGVYYGGALFGGGFDAHVLYHVALTGTRTSILEKTSRSWNHWFEYLRLSPNGRVMAFVLGRERQTSLPIPVLPGSSDLVLFDVQSGEEHSLGKILHTRGLMWSPDGKYLYVCGESTKEDGAVRIWQVEMARVGRQWLNSATAPPAAEVR